MIACLMVAKWWQNMWHIFHHVFHNHSSQGVNKPRVMWNQLELLSCVGSRRNNRASEAISFFAKWKLTGVFMNSTLLCCVRRKTTTLCLRRPESGLSPPQIIHSCHRFNAPPSQFTFQEKQDGNCSPLYRLKLLIYMCDRLCDKLEAKI